MDGTGRDARSSTRIVFTGHRNRSASTEDLETIAREFPESLWVHGGAIGFDTQVQEVAERLKRMKHGRSVRILQP